MPPQVSFEDQEITKVLHYVLGIQRFFRKNRERKENLQNALYLAAEFNLVSTLIRTINSGADVNLKNVKDSHQLNRSALHYAAGAGNDEIVGVLLAHGAILQEDAKKNTPIHYASQNTPMYLKSLVSAQSDWKATYITSEDMPWIEDALMLLLQNKSEVPIDAKNDSGQTPLHLSCSAGLNNIVRILCTHKADVSLADNLNRTALHLASWGGHSKTVKILLDADASPSVVNVVGRTPLHVAAVYGHLDVIKLLIENEAPLNAVNHNMNTPLHLSLLDGFKETASYLIDCGAETWLPNKNGDTALGICVEKYPDLAMQILDNCRQMKGGPSLFGDTVTVTYDFTGIDKQEPFVHVEPMELPSYGLVHPLSYRINLDNKYGARRPKDSSPGVVRKGSNRKLASLCEFQTPLFRMAAGNKRDLISHPVIINLLDTKWNSFAKRAYMKEVATHVLLTTLWVCGTVGWGAAVEVSPTGKYDLSRAFWASGGLLNAVLFWVFFGIIGYLLCREVVLLLKSGNRWRELQTRDLWWFYDMFTFAFLLTMVLAAHLKTFVVDLGSEGVLVYRKQQRVAIAIGSLLVWVRFLQFLAAHRQTGPFVKILARMIFDIVNFTLIYCVLLLAFAHAFFVVLSESFFSLDESGALVEMKGVGDEFDLFSGTILATYRCMINDLSFSTMNKSSSNEMTTVLFVAYTVTANILMMNLIVAMLNETYSMIKYDSTREWRLEWAKRILKIEGREKRIHATELSYLEVTEAAIPKSQQSKQEKMEMQMDEIERTVTLSTSRLTQTESAVLRLHEKMDLLLSKVASNASRRGSHSNSLLRPSRGASPMLGFGAGSLLIPHALGAVSENASTNSLRPPLPRMNQASVSSSKTDLLNSVKSGGGSGSKLISTPRAGSPPRFNTRRPSDTMKDPMITRLTDSGNKLSSGSAFPTPKIDSNKSNSSAGWIEFDTKGSVIHTPEDASPPTAKSDKSPRIVVQPPAPAPTAPSVRGPRATISNIAAVQLGQSLIEASKISTPPARSNKSSVSVQNSDGGSPPGSPVGSTNIDNAFSLPGSVPSHSHSSKPPTSKSRSSLEDLKFI